MTIPGALLAHALPRGFVFGAGAAGIKASGRPDVALIEAPGVASTAAMFTRNRVVAAPVVVGREHLAASRGRVRAIVVNAGNANCATGPEGILAAHRTCAELAALIGAAPEQVIPSSTGIIGVPLPVEKLVGSLASVVSRRSAEPEAALAVAHAIMTTDTRPKLASAALPARRGSATIIGIAKGAGMIHPDLATMLVYLLTDASASPARLRRALRHAVSESFHCISIDGDTSTNDTVVLLASGAADIRVAEDDRPFDEAVGAVCASLAEQIVADGEGVQHRVALRVEGAPSNAAAQRVAQTVARSLLVKTAWAGADPNWGRVLAAVGRSGVAIDPAAVDIWIAGRQVCARGGGVAYDVEGVHREMSRPAYEVRVRVGNGAGSARILTGDLTTEYVRINADYST
jgi:glutamate N-acetyltransferase/amino-acid N-acetyltransferase